jgi:hypothetical protein
LKHFMDLLPYDWKDWEEIEVALIAALKGLN